MDSERYLSDELLAAAVGFVKNGDNVPRDVKDRVLLALSLDNRTDLRIMNDRVEKVENHFLHKLTPKRLATSVGLFLTISAIYIEGSRDFLLDLARTILRLP